MTGKRKRMMLRCGALVAGISALGVATSPHAQMFSGFAGNMLMSRQALAPVRGLQLRSTQGVVSAHVRRSMTDVPRPAVSHARTDYGRDPAVSAKVRSDFVNLVRQSSGAKTAEAVEADFRRQDPVALWVTQVSSDGYRAGDMGDALAAYLALNWGFANHADLNRTQLAGLRRDMRQTLAADPAVARMSAAQRQAFSESLMCVFIYLEGDYNEALRSKDPRQLARLSDLAQARMRNDMGLDMRAMRIGPDGEITAG